MKVDWKKVSASPGYKSIKAKYVRHVQDSERDKQLGRRPMREKGEFLSHFKEIINTALKISYHTGEPIEDILNRWEAGRRYGGILNYHIEVPVMHSKSIKPKSLRGIKKYYKKEVKRGWCSPERLLQRSIEFQKCESKKYPKRWDTSKKRRRHKLSRLTCP